MFKVLYNTTMTLSSCLPRDWYARDALEVAHDLLGMILVRRLDEKTIHCRITETEAYRGEEDLACHARAGRTPRTAVMYGPPGYAYIYFTYGMHWCLNTVCMPEGLPAAVLIRGIDPLDGLDIIAKNRYGRPQDQWTNGPAKLTQALRIEKSLNGVDLTNQTSGLWIEKGEFVENHQIVATPRIGINSVPEPWRTMPWRYILSG